MLATALCTMDGGAVPLALVNRNEVKVVGE